MDLSNIGDVLEYVNKGGVLGLLIAALALSSYINRHLYLRLEKVSDARLKDRDKSNDHKTELLVQTLEAQSAQNLVMTEHAGILSRLEALLRDRK